MPTQDGGLELTILMPCLNEAETVGICVEKAHAYLARSGVSGEVLVADNGSTDQSRSIAVAKGARVVDVAERGYGAALRAGIAASHGRYIIMGDADDSYDFTDLDAFLARLRDGNDLVMGNRFRGGIAPGAMPPLHRYLGNPVLSLIGRLFFTVDVGDFHCGLRGFARHRVMALDLYTTGMEFASEIVIAASLRKYSIAEVPTSLQRDGRSRRSHLRTWRDGWQHLRFLLMFSPRWLFIYPGFGLMFFGLIGVVLLFPGPVRISEGVELDIHTFLIASIAMLVGLQIVSLGVVARRFATNSGFLPESERYSGLLAALSLERSLALAVAVALAGLTGLIWSLLAWISAEFGPLTDPTVIRVLMLSLMAIAAAVQLAFTAFLLSVMEIPLRRGRAVATDAAVKP